MASALAAKLWKFLTERRPARITIEELRRDIQAPSKAAVERAVAELEDLGVLSTEVLE